ncbi:MAG: diacylglycerol kinase family protein [Anaerobutyricum sp.]
MIARIKQPCRKRWQYDFVVAVGGVTERLMSVINGVVLSQSNTPVAVISAGTVNDFRNLSESSADPEENSAI